MIDERRAAADGVVEIPNLTAATLSRVVTYVKKHFGSGGANPAADDYHSTFVPSDDDPLACFDHKLVNVDNEALFDLIEAAEYLSIEKLLDLACKAVADQMRGRPLEEIRKTFNIVNDYTEEEEDEVRRENTWAFQSTV
ncbi:hypothetical protein HU200_062517 [Digitaria exilis]|uniref:SKP1-like protein n=1 Tax=Digitaria exilis TaxID=1010633 RepID=A0A835ACW1_9POAL|nr:hypothetical protein HU200_062517 [Digitaria exilis]